MDLNKWSPADIYLVRKDFDIGCIASEENYSWIERLYAEELDAGRLIGVS